MSAIKSNRLLLWVAAFHAVWFVLGPLLPKHWLSGITACSLIVSGIVLVAFYWRGFVNVMFRGQRDADEPGSHLSLFAAFSLGFAAIVGGVFNIFWVRSGRPTEWTGTVLSNYSSIAMAACYLSLAFAPHVGRGVGQWPKQSIMIAIGAASIFMAFVMGTQVQINAEPETWPASVWYGEDRPVCAPGRPVWGVRASRIYHTEQSRYRNLVVPDRCFHNEWEARAAGYRPPAD